MKEYYCLMKHKPRGVIPFSWLSSVPDAGTDGSEWSLQGPYCFLPKVVGKSSLSSLKSFLLRWLCSPCRMSPKQGW